VGGESNCIAVEPKANSWQGDKSRQNCKCCHQLDFHLNGVATGKMGKWVQRWQGDLRLQHGTLRFKLQLNAESRA